jgi:hypothetical protein
MIERFTRKSIIATTAAVMAALGVGGAAIAQTNSSSPPQRADTPAGAVTEAPGQESTAPENSAADPDDVQDENGKDDATEGPEGTEKESAEVPGDDGPGGHADEPGNPGADHQFEGVE